VLLAPDVPLVALELLELGHGVDVVEPRDVAAEDLLLGLLGQLDAEVVLQVGRQLEGVEAVEQPLRVPDREVGAPDDRSGPSQNSRFAITLAELARPVAEEHVRDGERGVDVRAAGRQPAEVVEPREAAVVDDEVQLGVQRRRLVDVAHVELLERQGLDRRALVEVHVLDAELDAALVQREHHRVVRAPAARLTAPLGGVPLEALHPELDLAVDLLQRVWARGSMPPSPISRSGARLMNSALRSALVKPRW
jgi:hypothetical protein